jgi:FKBP-type peptidyl-prolyl cis-trans isomerase
MDKKTSIAVAAGIIIVFVLLGGKGLLGFGSAANTNAVNNSQSIMQDNKSGLQSNDTVVGTGAVATAGKDVTVNYTGMFTDGKKFDSSLDRGVPFTFRLGAGQVIKGWDIGVEGMKVGGKRILVIPPELGYGAQAVGPIPANSTLVFQVELVAVK